MAAFSGWSLTKPFLRLAAAALLLAVLARAATSLDISSSHQLVAFSQEEFAMDTEIHRRVLAGRRPVYISYGSLTADRVPCPPMSGKSYYNPNCNGRGRANPYKRGCSTITRCRRDVS